MKLKLFGFAVLEIERDLGADPAPTGRPNHHDAVKRDADALCDQLLEKLHQSADILPRTQKGTIDVAASLAMAGIKQPEQLWRYRFKQGSAGAALKCVLGAKRRIVSDSRARGEPDLHTYPAEELPTSAETGKLDVPACLALFAIQDPSELWQKRFRPDSAGGRLKMCLRAAGFVPQALRPPASKRGASLGKEPPTLPAQSGLAQEGADGSDITGIKRGANGAIDIPASLEALAISDPKSLWQDKIQPGSPKHILKKEIARSLASRLVVRGITRADVGLTD